MHVIPYNRLIFKEFSRKMFCEHIQDFNKLSKTVFLLLDETNIAVNDIDIKGDSSVIIQMRSTYHWEITPSFP